MKNNQAEKDQREKTKLAIIKQLEENNHKKRVELEKIRKNVATAKQLVSLLEEYLISDIIAPVRAQSLHSIWFVLYNNRA